MVNTYRYISQHIATYRNIFINMLFCLLSYLPQEVFTLDRLSDKEKDI